MILKRQENNGIIKAIYSSSTICASIFDSNNRTLIVIFNNGGQYKYNDVTMSDYTRLETADSNGSVFNIHIKKKYLSFEKLENINNANLKQILDEVNELKIHEERAIITAKSKSIAEMMNYLIDTYNKTGDFDSKNLSSLKTLIEGYIEITSSKPVLE